MHNYTKLNNSFLCPLNLTMLYIALIITASYIILIGVFIWGFDRVNIFKLEKTTPKITFSVVIPFRNEASHLPFLLQSIENLVFPKDLFEVILVDDESTDNSVEIITEFLTNTKTDILIIKNKRTTNAPKKDAITNAINIAKHEWIVTTDADCSLPKYWLNSFDALIQGTQSQCIIAPVKYKTYPTLLSRFQTLDTLSLQAATMGGFGINSPFMCNGANFAYKISLFYKVNGFEGNHNMATGDDVFFLEKVVKHYPQAVRYIKCEDAIVTTNPEPSWQKLLTQRIRWASKTTAYSSYIGKLTGLIVFTKNILVVGLLTVLAFGIFNIKIALAILLFKFSVDWCLIYKSASFFNQKDALRSYALSFFIYPFLSTFIAFCALFKTYTWKGREFRH